MASKLFEIRDGRCFLTEAGRKASWPEFEAALPEEVKTSRPTFFRAKTSDEGAFVVGYHAEGRGLRRILRYGFVRLTEAERNLEPREVERKFGLERTAARDAIRRGWFEVRGPGMQRLTDLALSRIEGVGERLPEWLQDHSGKKRKKRQKKEK